MKMKINPNIVNKKFKNTFENETRFQIYFGGSSSSKSYSIFTFVPLWCLRGESILCIRANDAHITKSIWSETIKAISRLKLEKYFTINKTERSISCNITKGCIMFSGVQDVERLKSITPLKDNAFSVIICEEATELTEPQFNQIILRQRGKCNFKKRVIMLFNPILKSHWIYTRFFEPNLNNIDWNDLSFEMKSDEVYISKSTYQDNIHLSHEEIKTLEDMKDISYYHHQVYALGMFGVLGHFVYPDWTIINESQIPKNLEVRCGCDMGYNDLLTFTLSLYDRKNKSIYIVAELAFHQLSDLSIYAKAVKEIFMKFKLAHTQPITADTSDPRASDLLRGFGLNMARAVKGSGSKFAGIMFLKSHKLFVLDSCVKVIDSLKEYTWKEDKNGVSTDETNHNGSDLLDSIRYAFELDMRNQNSTFGTNKAILR